MSIHQTSPATLPASRARSAAFTTAWVVLVAVSALGALNHVVGVVAFAGDNDERMMFALFAGVNLYTVAVLAVSYRRREWWAWLATWLQVAAFALALPWTGPGIGAAYATVAAVLTVAQLATAPTFVVAGREVPVS